MLEYKELANLLFGDINTTPEYLEEKYPYRDLPEGTIVTRFGPSPTGFLHIGGVYAALISERIAHQSGGIFYLRIEDTDKKREVAGGVTEIVKSLKSFNIKIDEGPVNDDGSELGDYGPYKQSERYNIYKTYVKALIEKGMAYPCFCTGDELSETRNLQEKAKIRTGYYGEWAVHRNMPLNEIKSELASGKSFVIRLKSNGDYEKKFSHDDLIKGTIELPKNDQDVVILKSDGLPTYHFAHVVDDHLMRTTHVIRGDEWISSIPTHYQLFQSLGWEVPKYAHISPILKTDGNGKRKLSKRKDPEASITYYHEQGFPVQAVIEYLMNLVNSNFEEWRTENMLKEYGEFRVDIKKMSISGALFDIQKLSDISRDIIALMSNDEVYDYALTWANEYDKQLAQLMLDNELYSKMIFNIERTGEKPRKDIGKWSDIRNYIEYFYDETFYKDYINKIVFTENICLDNAKKVLSEYIKVFNYSDDKDMWFSRIKEMGEKLGYAANKRKYKKNPDMFIGDIGDVCMVIRVVLTKRFNSPDLHEIMCVMGEEKVIKRMETCLEHLNEQSELPRT